MTDARTHDRHSAIDDDLPVDALRADPTEPRSVIFDSDGRDAGHAPELSA